MDHHLRCRAVGCRIAQAQSEQLSTTRFQDYRCTPKTEHFQTLQSVMATSLAPPRCVPARSRLLLLRPSMGSALRANLRLFKFASGGFVAQSGTITAANTPGSAIPDDISGPVSLDPIAQHQLFRMRGQVELAHHVGVGMAPEMMPDQRNRHYQRQQALAILLDGFHHFLPVEVIDLFL